MLFVVAFRNLIELSGSSFNFSEGFALPKSFGWFRGNNVLWTISYVCIITSPWRVNKAHTSTVAYSHCADLGDAG